jgi:acylphosphatase
VTSDARIVRRVSIRGKVQGVGFRAFVAHEAQQRNLEGWVRNRLDGTVEAVFAGPEKTIAAMIATCRIGPLGGHVDGFDQWEGSEEELTMRKSGEAFSFLHTV